MSKTKAEERREKLRNRSRQAVKTRDQKGLGKKSALDWARLVGKKPPNFIPTTGKDNLNLIDILPFVITQSWYKDLRTFSGLTTNLEVGDWDYKLEIPVHKNVGEDNDTFLCLRLAFGKKCPLCEEMFKEYEKDNPDEKKIKPLKPSWRDYFNIYDYNDEDKDLQVWEDVSYHLFEKYFLAEADEGENTILYSDIEEGKTIEIKAQDKTIGSGKPFPEAQNIEFKNRDKYEEEIVNDTVSFDSLVKIPTFEDVSRIHRGLEDEGTPDQEKVPAGEEPPAPSGRRRQTRQQPAKEENPPSETQDQDQASGPACPYKKVFGADCDPTADECKKCPEETFSTCADKLDEIEKGEKETPPPPATTTRRRRQQPGNRR